MNGPELFAVIGKPIIHSRSPEMHNAAFGELSIDAHYIRLAAESGKEGLASAREMGIRGLNVTAPFKDMGGILDETDKSADEAGAVNTVILRGKSRGYNTDVHGIAESFLSNGLELKGRKALVLGAGGAAGAAVLAMLSNGAEVTIANRTVENAAGLARRFGAGHCPLSGHALEKAISRCEIIIGCLSTGERVIPGKLLRREITVMDAYYAAPSALVQDGRAAGCRIIDGREWLLHQGAKSFELFTGRKAPIAAMRKAAYGTGARAKRNIALVGFMGSGKNTASKELHAKTGMPVIDVDERIEKKAGMQVKEIFQSMGEPGFRALETAEIASLESGRGKIISCGGGAVLERRNRESLGRSSLVLWLFADLKTTMARIPRDGNRPLLAVDEPEKEAGRLLSGRMGAYAESCDIALDTTGKTPDEISERILYEVRKAIPDIGKD
ncbi:MAG TPA: shikimate kinase [Candidatus Bilamarchaeum sp.]|nr:shikimate kinase [Candidatus Bilamarchaeum sp.]